MSSRFVPDSWQLTEPLRKFARDKGLSEKQIDEQLERFRDCEFPKPRIDFDRCWRRWIRNAIDWGQVVPTLHREYLKPAEYTEEQRKIDRQKAEKELARLQLRVVR